MGAWGSRCKGRVQQEGLRQETEGTSRDEAERAYYQHRLLPWDRRGARDPCLPGKRLRPAPTCLCTFAEHGTGPGFLSWREPGPSGPAVPAPLPLWRTQCQQRGWCSGRWEGVKLQLPRPQSLFLPFMGAKNKGEAPGASKAFRCVQFAFCLHLEQPGFGQPVERAAAQAREGA